MSKGKKIFLVILGIMIVIVVGIGAFAAKVYLDVKASADKTYEKVERVETPSFREEEPTIAQKDAFSVLLMGLDTGDEGRSDQGRSDTMLLVTVSPEKQQTTMVSLERDTYTEIVGHGSTEKLNAAYAYGGPGMAMDTVQNLLQVPVDHYVTIDMAGLKELVDAVGGIEVNNSFQFTFQDSTFDVGQIHLNGENALKYSRMRYDDPRGNYGRQERQRKVITGIVKKALSFSGASQYQSILDTISANMKTDLTFDEMQKLALDYRDCFSNIKGDQLTGTGFMQDSVSYQRVSEEEINRVRTEINDQLGLT